MTTFLSLPSIARLWSNFRATPWMLGFVLACLPTWATAQQTLGSMIDNSIVGLWPLQSFVGTIFYVLGLFFALTALKMLKEWVDNPGQPPLSTVVLRFLGAGLLFSAPYVSGIIVNTITGAGGGSGRDQTVQMQAYGVNNNAGGTANDGVEMLENLIGSIWIPMMDFAIPFACYVMGLIFLLVGLKRMAQGQGDGPQAPGGIGTLGTIFAAAALMSVGTMMSFTQSSLFGTTELFTSIHIPGIDNSLQGYADRTFTAVFAFLKIVGYLSFVRGIFILRSVAEGAQNATTTAAATHIIAGAICANMPLFLETIELTVGVDFIQGQRV